MIKEILKNIEKFLIKRNYSSDIFSKYPGIKLFDDAFELEKTRLENDLRDIETKLIQGEYLLKDFSSKNIYDISGRQREFFIYLQSYLEIAQSRKEAFHGINLQNNQKIIEICPGWSPKISLGLYYLGYTGEFSLLDIDQNALKMINEFMNLFKTKYSITSLEGDLFAPKKSYDIVSGNHIIDDLLVYYYQQNIDQTFSLKRFYQDENYSKAVRSNILSRDQESLGAFITSLKCAIDTYTNHGGTVIINHYKSYVDDIYKQDDVFLFCILILNKLENAFLSSGYTIHPNKNLIRNRYFVENNFLLVQKK